MKKNTKNIYDYQYAQVYAVDGNYYGARATINVWNPLTNFGELSIAQIWVLAGDGNELNSLEAGWTVIKLQPMKHVYRLHIYSTCGIIN